MVPTLMALGEVGTRSTSPPQRADSAVASVNSGTRSKRKPKTTIGTDSRTVLPTDDDEKKSLTVGRYQFRKDGAGWECREIVGKGINRKRPYLAHLSRNRYEQMQAKSETRGALERLLLEWAEDKREGKQND